MVDVVVIAVLVLIVPAREEGVVMMLPQGKFVFVLLVKMGVVVCAVERIIMEQAMMMVETNFIFGVQW